MKKMLVARLVLALCLMMPTVGAPAHAAVADLDLTFAGFGAGGKVMTDILGGSNVIFATALQPDGKVVVAGVASDALVVARYHDNGVLDGTFGSGGYTRTPAGVTSRAYAVALQADGRIVVAGMAEIDGSRDFVVARYTAFGELDASFGGGAGIVTTNFVGGDDQARGVVVQSTGKIVAVGFARSDAGGYDFALARYCPSGDLDDGTKCGAGGFGSGGRVTTGFGYDEFAFGRAASG